MVGRVQPFIPRRPTARRRLPLDSAIFVSAILIGLVLIGHALDLAGAHGITPGPGSPVVGIDMVSDASNTGTNLGVIDPCTEIANTSGTQFTVDAWIDAVPNDLDLDGYNYLLNFPDSSVRMV